jgi:hypothetical protein
MGALAAVLDTLRGRWSRRRLGIRLGGQRRRRLCRGRLLVDPKLMNMQPRDLKVLDLELPHDRSTDRQPTDRQGADGAGAHGHRPHRGRPNASRCQLHRGPLLPTAAKREGGSG